MIGSQGDSRIAKLCNSAIGASHALPAALPAEFSYVLNLANNLLAEPLEFRDGMPAVRDAPDVGAGIGEEKLARYRVDL